MADTEYGLTSKGPNIKRLDVILEEMHEDLSGAWGVNTQQNPESLLNHLLTNIADQIAELWEFGENVYYSQYPSSAEGISLDNTAQLGGTVREGAEPSYYKMHCTGVDGAVLAAGTLIASDTNPAVQLTLEEEKELSRSSCNKAVIRVLSASAGDIYTILIDDKEFEYTAEAADELEILEGLAAALEQGGFEASVDEEELLLSVSAPEVYDSFAMALTDNLTTETVTSILTFATVDTGDICLPLGAVTKIVKADSGLESVENRIEYIAGRDEETDTEFRQSYIDRIFNRSCSMAESIRSAILENVQGVTSAAVYENPSDETDSVGRPPHSVEAVVDGGDEAEIAEQILASKAGGISTYGEVEITLPGEYGEEITIRFNRPIEVYVWYYLKLTVNAEEFPANGCDLLREAIIENMGELAPGDDVVPQSFLSDLYEACSGVTYIDLYLCASEEESYSPVGSAENYTLRSLELSERYLAVTTEEMIDLDLDAD